jgi:hypothetical protein
MQKIIPKNAQNAPKMQKIASEITVKIGEKT